jgi:hypothetical protein
MRRAGIVLAALAVLALSLPAAAAAAAPRLTVERTGGIAGVHDRLVIGKHGGATVTHRDGAAERLPAARTWAVRRALRAARFATLAPAYRPPGVINDGFTYVLRSGGHRVRVEQGAENVPRRLRDLISAAGELLLA